jgi:hypothetical protein
LPTIGSTTNKRAALVKTATVNAKLTNPLWIPAWLRDSARIGTETASGSMRSVLPRVYSTPSRPCVMSRLRTCYVDGCFVGDYRTILNSGLCPFRGGSARLGIAVPR